MTPRQKSRGVGKTRRNPVAANPEPVAKPVAKKSSWKAQEPERRIADIDFSKNTWTVADIDFSKNTWTVKETARWAGVPERTLYRMLRAGVLPCIAMGDMQEQKLSKAKSGKRVRKCYRFVIPRVAFMKAWENLSSAGTVGNPAA
jgi:hypothetical protein